MIHVEIVESLQNHKKFCKQKSERRAFFLRSSTHQLLAAKNIILFKEKEYDPFLSHYINIEDIELLRDTVSREYESKEKIDDWMHARLIEIGRGVNSKSNRCNLKKELAKLYETASADDERTG
ncbi:unnamed protein product [Mucor fragilis]